MDNQNSTYGISDSSENGSVRIAEGVLPVIAAYAATDVKGVVSMAGNITQEMLVLLGMKKLSRGVRVTVDDNDVMVDLSVIIEMNTNIMDVSKKIQDKVRVNIQNMTGMNVANVNVNIASVAEEPAK